MKTKLPRQISMLIEIYTAYKNKDFKISPRFGKTII